MIGDFLLLFGVPSVVTAIIWILQAASGRLCPSATYFRRRVFGCIFVIILLFAFFSLVALMGGLSSPSAGGISSSALGGKMGRFIFIDLAAAYWFGLKDDDGFIRAIFTSYSSLPHQAKERLAPGPSSSPE